VEEEELLSMDEVQFKDVELEEVVEEEEEQSSVLSLFWFPPSITPSYKRFFGG
jgi:hypothetical protein